MSDLAQPRDPVSRRNWCWLAFWGGLLALMWLTVLPAITRQPGIAARIRRLEAQGIDPSAIFYTELDAMPAAEAHLRRVRSRGEDPLW